MRQINCRLSTHWNRLLYCLLVWLFAGQQLARSCMCFSSPLCSGLPVGGGKLAVFVGTATDIYPNLNSTTDRKHTSRTEMTASEKKTLLLERWRGVLTVEETQSIQSAKSVDNVFWGNPRIGLETHRARFQVVEWLQGGSGASFEVFTDSTSCGYQFEAGTTFLVVARLNPESMRWQTGACMRNAPVVSRTAQEDLRALRATRDGYSLPPHVYGEVVDNRNSSVGLNSPPGLPAAVLRLTGPSSSRETTTDGQGWFAFDDLQRGTYRLELLQPSLRGQGATIDLGPTACSEVFVYWSPSKDGGEYCISSPRKFGIPKKEPVPMEEAPVDLPPKVPVQIPDALQQGLLAPENGWLHWAPAVAAPSRR